MQAPLDFFPISYFKDGARVSGFQYTATDRCGHCDRQCQLGRKSGIQTCSYNVNYVWAPNNLLLFGFVLRSPQMTRNVAKVLRQNPKSAITPDSLQAILKLISATKLSAEEDISEEKLLLIQEYKDKQMFKRDLLDLIRPELRKNLAFLHDYKQFVSRVKQNINVILETRYQGGDLDNKLSRSTKEEAAIYWLSAMMSEKLQTAFLLLNPERLEWEERQTFRAHGLIVKYMKIYGAAFKEKGVVLTQSGYSEGYIRANAAAFSIIPHTLIDNALKYSQAGSSVTIFFKETTESIQISVMSFGPKIESDEMNRIFEIFYRGKSARLQEEEGVGFGLYLAQYVAHDLGTELKVVQSGQKLKFGYETTFSLVLSRIQ